MPKLTDKFIERLQPPAEGRLEVWDTLVPGLGIRVGISGRKTWNVMFRLPGSPAKHRMTLGTYPLFGLADARQKAREALRMAAEGEIPARQKSALEALLACPMRTCSPSSSWTIGTTSAGRRGRAPSAS
jgi:hypothetical protein